MTMTEYQQLAQRTINENLDAQEKMMHALHGMASEVGEIHGNYQKSYQGHEVDGRELQKELGDLLWFITEFCTAAGWDLGYIAHKNIEKLRKRYPEGFSAERSINRED